MVKALAYFNANFKQFSLNNFCFNQKINGANQSPLLSQYNENLQFIYCELSKQLPN